MARKQSRILNTVPPIKADDFRLIRGIGPRHAARLHDAGIHTFTQLASLPPAKLAGKVSGLSVKQITHQDWIGQAWKIARKKPQPKHNNKTTASLTIRQHYENFTIEFLVNEKNKLRRLRIMHIQSGDIETWTNWNPEEISHFLERHTGVQFPKEKSHSQEALAAKTKQSHPSTGKLVEPGIKTPPKKRSQESAMVSTTKVKKVQGEITQTRTKQSRSKARKLVKPIVKTPPTEISQKPEAPSVPKVEQDQARSGPLEIGQSNQLAPIPFKLAAEVLPNRFLQMSIPSPVPEEIKHQADSVQPEAPKHQTVGETKSQMGVIRLLKWNNLMAGSDQPVQSLPHDQTFDVKLTLDISSLPVAAKSQLDITGSLLAKKLGGHERGVIGEKQVVIPYSPIISLHVGRVSLEEGLYRLEAQIKLNDSEATAPTKSIYASLQGGLIQVY